MHFQSGASLVLGGARSGKSAFAERCVRESGRSAVYIATSQTWGDIEMQERVALHKQRRGQDWHLVEEPLELAETLAQYASPDHCLLVDCLTLWLTNVMLADRDVGAACQKLVQQVNELQRDCSVLFVSNEVGQGIVPVDKMARAFRDHAGRLHQNLAAIVPHVWFVTAGLPQKLK